jgi:hypothetical protein
MNLRHTAALALVGWYLIVFSETGRCIGCETGPAITDVWGIYADASDCEVEERKVQALLSESEKHPKGTYVVYRATYCGASDEWKRKGVQLRFLSLSEKHDMITNGH